VIARRTSEEAKIAKRWKERGKALAWERETLQRAGDRARTLVARADAYQPTARGDGTALGEPVIVVHGWHGRALGVHDQHGALIGLIVRRDGTAVLQARHGRLVDDDGQQLCDEPDVFTVKLAFRKRPVPFAVCAPDGTDLAVAHRERLEGGAPAVVAAHGSRYRRHPLSGGKPLIGWLAIPHRSFMSIGQDRDWFVEDATFEPKARIVWASRVSSRLGLVAILEEDTPSPLRCVALAAMAAADHARGSDHP
jgi:hypothetical protein